MVLQVHKQGGNMKRVVCMVIAMLLVTTLCYAQTSRNASPATQALTGKTQFSNIGIHGLDVDGNPGYIEIRGTNAIPNESDDTAIAAFTNTYYLWVKSDGDLCIASYGTVAGQSSFPYGDWRNLDSQCTVVGGQT